MAPNILIIDDEDGMRTGLSRILEDEGYQVSSAENGVKGIEKFQKGNFDIVLVDLKLPDLDGIEIIKKISAQDDSVIIIMMTAYASFETAVDSVKSGAFDYISKPFSPDEILYAIMRGLQKREILLERARLLEEKERNLLLLAEEKSQFEQVISEVADGIAIINLDGIFVKTNRLAEKILFPGQKTNYPVKLNSMPHMELRAIIENKLLIVQENSSSCYEVLLGEESQEEKRHYLITLAPVVKSGNIRGILLTLQDIENFKRMEAEQSKFLRVVAHELKAPVNATVSILELLMNGYVNDPQKQTEFLNRASERCRGLVQMIEDLLELSKMEVFNKKGELSFEKINILEEVSECLSFFQPQADAEGIHLESNLPQEPVYLSANRSLIRQLLNNLISNGIKYNRENGSVKISLIKEGNILELLVKDDGIGIEKEKLQGLFREFYRVKNTQTESKKGTGLGLSIAKKAVELHGGKIQVESVFGQGTTFCVKFPCEG